MSTPIFLTKHVFGLCEPNCLTDNVLSVHVSFTAPRRSASQPPAKDTTQRSNDAATNGRVGVGGIISISVESWIDATGLTGLSPLTATDSLSLCSCIPRNSNQQQRTRFGFLRARPFISPRLARNLMSGGASSISTPMAKVRSSVSQANRFLRKS